MPGAAATAWTSSSGCWLNRTAVSLNSRLYSRTFLSPGRATDTPLLDGSVYESEGGSPGSSNAQLGGVATMGAWEGRRRSAAPLRGEYHVDQHQQKKNDDPCGGGPQPAPPPAPLH